MPRRPWNKRKRWNKCKRKKGEYKGFKVSLPCRSNTLTKVAKEIIDVKIPGLAKKSKTDCRIVFMSPGNPQLLCAAKRRTDAQRKKRAKDRWGRKKNCIKRNTSTGLFYRKAGCKT